MPQTIAILADLRYAGAACSDYSGDWADILLTRAVRRLARFIKPDAVLLLGDCLDDPDAPGAAERLHELRTIMEHLDCPWAELSGSADAQALPGLQLLPTAGDSPTGLAHLRGDGIDLLIERTVDNKAGIIQGDGGAVLRVDALSVSPFRYTLLSVGGGSSGTRLDSRSEALAMPSEYGLVDTHSHTQFAYCGENVSSERSPTMADMMGLRALTLTEHSGQLYFPVKRYWSASFAEGWKAQVEADDSRVEDYLRITAPLRSERLRVGLEVDADFDGNLVLQPEHAQDLQLVVGAVHVLREGQKPEADPAVFAQEFTSVTERLCLTGIDVLAHPFRMFKRKQLTPDPALYLWMAQLLKRAGVVAELNFHTNDPAVEFVQHCLELEVPLTFGGDSHHLYEVGEFYPQLALLREAGVSGDPTVHLWNPDERGPNRNSALIL